MNRTRKLICRTAIAAGLAAIAAVPFTGDAIAGTDTADITVTATVIDNCTISTGNISFGNYDPIVANASTDATANGSVTVTCTSGDTVQMTLDGGDNESGSSTTNPIRRMTDGTNFLGYFLFSDAGLTTKWASDASVDKETTGTGASDAHTVYGVLTQAQNVPAGAYTDTVTATVTF